MVFLPHFEDSMLRIISFVYFGVLITLWAPYYIYDKIDNWILQRTLNAARDSLKKYEGYFASKGLRWVVPDSFPKWVELWNDWYIEESHAVVKIPESC